ncbi:MAG: replicative DNA helicase [Bdellovibrionaceae bacterium]|nr:replicative DNA helicase [Pseudobdellovibrionaceae bacterium]
MTKEKQAPHNIEAEIAVLGGIMLDPNAWTDIQHLLKAGSFYKPSHQKIFTAMEKLSYKNEPIDLVTLSNLLTNSNQLELIGGHAYLSSIIDNTHSTSYLSQYANIVAEKAKLRQLINICGDISHDAYSENFEEYPTFIDKVESDIFSVTENKSHSQQLTEPSVVVKSSVALLEKLYSNPGQISGISSGFEALDTMTSGFHENELIIIAARPSMGKTALGLNIALHAALREKKKVAFFSVEMSKEALMMRLLSNLAEIHAAKMRTGKLSDSDWTKLIDAAAKLSETSLFLDDSSMLTPLDVRAKVRRMKKKQGLDLIVVDYLQLMTAGKKVESREREVSEISRLLKAVAKELNIPVVALAQLNRGVEGRSDRRPILSDLRESGSIEQDADLIMMLYRESYYEPDKVELKNKAEIIITKQRSGPTGYVNLAWFPEYGRFTNPVTEIAPSPAKQTTSNTRFSQSASVKNWAPK